jgi:acetate kinase
MALLTVNAGSSSLKLALYDDGAALRKATVSVERIGSDQPLLQLGSSNSPIKITADDHAAAFEEIFTRLPELFGSNVNAIGYRLVHGGADHHQPQRVTPALIDALNKLAQIDPTHTPQALAVIAAITKCFPDVPQFVCFDTAFHRSMPEVAQCYPLARWTAELGVRRYGFHGLSCESIIHQLAKLNAAGGRVLIAHLGNGASVTAVRDGAGVETTMGFSPTGGMMMGTRSGDLDPTVMTFLARSRQMDTDALEQLFNEQSGLVGVSGLSQDMRDLLDAADSNIHAAEAIELYCYTAQKSFGAFAAVLGGVDTIVFTGGIGEHAAPIREKICERLQHLGVQLDAERNGAGEPVISSAGSRVVVRVIRTDEELVIAKHIMRLLGERRK